SELLSSRVLGDSLRMFLQHHAADPTLSGNFEVSEAVKFVETCSTLIGNRKTIKTHLDLEFALQRTREALENLAETLSPDDATRDTLVALYGSWFKCSRPWCDSFYEGFDKRSML